MIGFKCSCLLVVSLVLREGVHRFGLEWLLKEFKSK